jgi:hypothetical protein
MDYRFFPPGTGEIVMMTGASLAMILLLGQVPAPDPQTLVPGLGAPRYADRQAASTALEQLGRRALPALRRARDLKDLEVRTRAAALIVKIEGSLLTQPTMVTLDFQDAPLVEVVKSVSDQTGIKLSLVPPDAPNWKNRRVSVKEPAPLPFWKAIDRLCDAAHLQYNFGMHAFPNGREPGFPLFEGGGRPSAPTFDTGPFRVSIVGLHYQRDVSFPPIMQNAPRPVPGQVPTGRLSPSVSEQCYAQIQVAGEPRLAISQSGALKVTEAVDDKNQALVPPAMSNPIMHRASGYFGFATGPVVQLQAPLTRPSQPGTAIKRLKGVVPIAVSTRKPGPLVVALANSSGRTFQNDDVAITVHEIRAQANNGRPPTIEVSIHPTASGASASAGGFGTVEMGARPDSYQQQIEVADARDRIIPWYQTSFDAEAGRLTMTLTAPDQAATPSELRFFSLVRANTEVSFEFNDVLLP